MSQFQLSDTQPILRLEGVELVNPTELRPHPKNPNKHPDAQIERLGEIIGYQGWRRGVTVSQRSGFITVGHGRTEVAIKNGWLVPVSYQEYESEDQEIADLVADNAIDDWAKLDFGAINDLVPLLGPDFDLDLLGIKNFTLDVETEEEESGEGPAAEPITKLGDLWILGQHRLLCGDSTHLHSVDRLLEGQKAQMLFTDPPYGVGYTGGIQFEKNGSVTRDNRDALAGDDNADLYTEIAPVIYAFVDGPCYVWFADTKAREVMNALHGSCDFHAMIIWHKINATYAAMNAHYKQRHEPCLYMKTKGSTLRWSGPSDECTVWDMKKDARNDLHPTQKPIELAERAIKNHEAESVLDLFGGSGSTLIACEKLNRRAYVMELEPKYCDVIVARWEKYTGLKAERAEVV